MLSDREKNTVVSEFREDTKWIREDREWTGPSIPQDLQCRHVEITGPTSNTKMFINALNSKADCYMTDIEDSLSPSWKNIQDAHHNIYQAVRGQLSYSSNGKEYQINPETPTLLVRTRGLHTVSYTHLRAHETDS